MDGQTQNRSKKTNEKSSSTLTKPSHHEDDLSKIAITIGKPVEDVFAFWRNFENLATFMKDIKSIKAQSAKKSHWVIELKNGLKAQWDAEVTGERENEMISWQSTQDSEVQTTGTVWFAAAPAGMGTVVSLLMDYKVPGGKLTEMLTKFIGEDTETLIKVNLRRLKALLETGDIPTIEGQSSGRGEDKESTNVKH